MSRVVGPLALCGIWILALVAASPAQGASINRLEQYVKLEKPTGEGPFPVVLLLPGCKGFHTRVGGPYYDSVESNLIKDGYVVARVDYFSANDQESCNNGAVSIARGAKDTVEVAKWLQAQSYVKHGSVNILGWSFGGGAALATLSDNVGTTVNAVVAFYPGCRHVKPWKQATPTLVLFGQSDNVVSLDTCKQVFAAISDPASLQLHTYANAYHLFDFRGLPDRVQYPVGTIGYNKVAATAAWDTVLKFLHR